MLIPKNGKNCLTCFLLIYQRGYLVRIVNIEKSKKRFKRKYIISYFVLSLVVNRMEENDDNMNIDKMNIINNIKVNQEGKEEKEKSNSN